MGGGGREERGREERSVCARQNFPCSSLCSSAWESCWNGATPHTPHGSGLPAPLHLLLMVQLTGAKGAVLSIILIPQCFSSLFSPGSHGNQPAVVWLQCCCRRSPVPVPAAPDTAQPWPPILAHLPPNPAPAPSRDPGTLLIAPKLPDLSNNPCNPKAGRREASTFLPSAQFPWEYSNVYWHKVLLEGISTQDPFPSTHIHTSAFLWQWQTFNTLLMSQIYQLPKKIVLELLRELAFGGFIS